MNIRRTDRTLRDGAVTAFGMAGILGAMAVSSAPAVAQADQPTLPDSGWVVISRPHVDLWFHGMAVIGFGLEEDFPLYNADYVERVQATKRERGVAPTPLDTAAARFKREFEKEQVFQNLHFTPLYFPTATASRMLAALRAVADRRVTDSVVGPDTRTGIRYAAATFKGGKERRLLREFVQALETEWTAFYRAYWEETVGARSEYPAQVQRRWNTEIAPAIRSFLTARRLTSGRIVLSPALGPEGRLIQANAFQQLDAAVGVGAPDPDNPDASLFTILRELCFSIVGDSKGAVRCGSMLLEKNAPGLVPQYQRVLLGALGRDTTEADVSESFTKAYDVNKAVIRGLANRIGLALPSDTAVSDPGWTVEPKVQTDLWFHVLAVIQADEPGPLGLYSADYARQIREIKQERGVYPTLADSMAAELRKDIASEASLQLIHFVPLYFPRTEPEKLFVVLRAVARQRPWDPEVMGPADRRGVAILSQNLRSGKSRRTLQKVVDVAEREWEAFYRDYWETLRSEQEARYTAIQVMWDSLFAPKLTRYLRERRLASGTVTPSPALGPEGRIVDFDNFDASDQSVAVQLPLSTSGPEASVYAFLKELCFVIIDDRQLRSRVDDPDELEDLRRRIAVRCGAIILDFYAPTLTAGYRRAFLDAVGAQESSTVAAFERVYFLEPDILELIREQIRRR